MVGVIAVRETGFKLGLATLSVVAASLSIEENRWICR